MHFTSNDNGIVSNDNIFTIVCGLVCQAFDLCRHAVSLDTKLFALIKQHMIVDDR